MPYAVFDSETMGFGPVRCLEMPDTERFFISGAGCSQCVEEENGDLLFPLTFSAKGHYTELHERTIVVRCSFDGQILQVKDIGNVLDIPDDPEGLCEGSLVLYNNRYYLTLRSEKHGYVCVSNDGIHYSSPEPWKWDSGDILPTYKTQSHWIQCGGRLLLVYTRKNGKNDHVFRHRAPLYAAEVDVETLSIKRNTEFIVVPERGTRLGNFGACSIDETHAIVTTAEWMQPKGCEEYGSNNAIWYSEIHIE